MAVITLSREAHSGTRDLARRLADRLGYRYVSRDEVTAAVAARSGLHRSPVTAESEGRALSFLEQLGEQLTGDRASYRAALKSVIVDLAAEDNVVIVGHGAGLFLREIPTVVRVFVVAPMRERLERVIAEQDVDADHARRVVEQEDRESAEYLRYLFGINWLDPHEWDLMVNSGQAHMDATLDMLAEYVAGLQRSDAEREALERVQLASRLEQVLLADEDLGVDHVRVRLEGGTVVLEGQALSEEDRERAESAARATAPGAALDNRIVVHPPASV